MVGAYLFGWPSIIAVIVNDVKRDEARGTWLESPFTSQIRTVEFAMLWAALVGAVLAIVLVGFAIWLVGFVALGIWAIYRIARGLLALNAHRALP